jgi:hypothetical protein
MSASDQENKARDREIAKNEAERQATSAIRVSGWAIAFALIVGAIAVFIVFAWLKH